jgi:hypothetical protein
VAIPVEFESMAVEFEGMAVEFEGVTYSRSTLRENMGI